MILLSSEVVSISVSALIVSSLALRSFSGLVLLTCVSMVMDDIGEGVGISEMISTERSSALLSLAGSFSTDEAEVRLLDRLNLDLRSFIGSGDLGLELELSEALPLESLTLSQGSAGGRPDPSDPCASCSIPHPSSPLCPRAADVKASFPFFLSPRRFSSISARFLT